MNEINLIEQIYQKAKDSGFDLVGIAPAVVSIQDRQNILGWVEQKKYASMDWYPNNMSIRLDFQNLGFTPISIIALGILYKDEDYNSTWKDSQYKISSYACGKDYHKVLREKAKPLLSMLKEQFPQNHFRQGVDTLPIPEKVLARNAGLGWIGKNTCLINPQIGSYFFLSILLTDLPLLLDSNLPTSQPKDRCGKCRACIDSCPTGALNEYQIDAGKCISYLTIENREETFQQNTKLSNYVYGCDICQQVCPWNRIRKIDSKATYTKSPEFKIRKPILESINSLEKLTEDSFQKLIKDSAMDRIQYYQWRRNIGHIT